MKTNSKHAFWQALVITIAIFIIGIFIGIAYENGKILKINEKIVLSDLFLMDSFALSNIEEINETECQTLIYSNIKLADRIYNEAKLLEKYEGAEKITESLKIIHKRYDILRTILWINVKKIPEKCMENTSTIIYLYEHETEDLSEKAENNVMSRVLLELKQEYEEKIILIPISVDAELISLEFLISNFNITKYPALIIDDKYVITRLQTPEQIKEYLK